VFSVDPMSNYVRTSLIAAALLLWIFFETAVVSQFSLPVSAGWWGILFLMIISWFVSRTAFFILAGVVALGYETVTLQPFGIITIAVFATGVIVMFLEQKMFTRLSFLSYGITILCGMLTFLAVILLIRMAVGLLANPSIPFETPLFLKEQSFLLIYYLCVAFGVLAFKKAGTAFLRRYFVST